MATAISSNNQPTDYDIEYVYNNAGRKDLICNNYQFYRKSLGKSSACFRCSQKGCYASISLKTEIKIIDGTETPVVVEPFRIKSTNWNHKEGCLPKLDDNKKFIKNFFQQCIKILFKSGIVYPGQKLIC